MDAIQLLDYADLLEGEGQHAEADVVLRQAARQVRAQLNDADFHAALDQAVAAHGEAGDSLNPTLDEMPSERTPAGVAPKAHGIYAQPFEGSDSSSPLSIDPEAPIEF